MPCKRTSTKDNLTERELTLENLMTSKLYYVIVFVNNTK